MRKLLVSLLLLLTGVIVNAGGMDSLKISILGDSYSTYEGSVTPDTNAIWYYRADNPKLRKQNDVRDVSQTWWYQVIDQIGGKLEVNNSYSGSTICHTGYKHGKPVAEDYRDRSFVTRDNRLGNPDLILVCGGTNDSWAGVPIGEYLYDNQTTQQLYSFRPAMAKLLNDLQVNYPKAKIIFILNSELRPSINESVHVICNHYDVPCVDLKDIEKQGGHPSVKGMKSFADQVVKEINRQYSGRAYWASLAYRIGQPVLENMAKGVLQKNMQTEFSPSFDKRDRRVAYMETFGRLMAGIAPWLALPSVDNEKEEKQRAQLREWALASYKNAVDTKSPDYLCWGVSGQNLVDAAYIAESFLRAYDALWKPLDSITKSRYIREFQGLRKIDPPYTNWLLFSSVIESFLAKAGAQYDEYRVNMACRKCEEWYVGDGWYSDGPVFAFNYYASYVFHPMYLETLQAMIDAKVNSRIDYRKYYDRELLRTQRYSIILERLISPEGTFPVFGRSIPYRMAAMQPLALMSWCRTLPKELTNGQVRAALTQTLHRMFDNQENFNKGGYLTIGFCGSQPETADWYTNNGSLYMTSLVFMPLGLPATDPFWTDKPEPWTQVKAWNGMSFPKDHHWVDQIQTKDKW